jgi:hypothetical protein
VSCTGRLDTKSVRCGLPSTSASRDLIIGAQGVYVTLASSNVQYDGGTSIFSFDVTVQNLIPQAFGTNDGATPDGTGVNVFFSNVPTVTGGTGSASVANATGTGTFTAAGQPYFQYPGSALGGDQILSQNETSSALTWQLNIDPTVTSFEFDVYVSTNVHYPNGYVDVTNPSQYLVQTGSQTISGVARTAVGNPVAGTTISYASSAPAVATVDPSSGAVTAVAPGLATITATSSDSKTGTTNVQVCPNLAVGEVYNTSGPDAQNTCLVGGSSGAAEYTIIPYNTSPSSALSVTVTGSNIQAVTGPPNPVKIPTSVLTMGSTQGGAAAAQEIGRLALSESMHQVATSGDVQPAAATVIHEVVAEDSETEHGPYVAETPDSSAEGTVPVAGGRERLMWYPTESTTGKVAASDDGRGMATMTMPPAVPTVGDLVTYNTQTACGGADSFRTGMVRSVKQHAVIVSDTANPAGGFTTAQYDSIALEYDTLAYPVDSAAFGPVPTDNDANGRVVLFFTRAVNELSPPASSSVNLGYFAPKDNQTTGACSTSNFAEMMYMLVPDPTGAVNSNVRTVSFVRGNTSVTSGHELTRLTINGTRAAAGKVAEAAWFEQALAYVGEELLFYQASVGLSPGGNIALSNLTTGPNASRRVAAFNTYANQNFGRFRSWLQRPDTAGLGGNGVSLARNGYNWAFVRYISDRLAVGDNTFLTGLVQSSDTGRTALTTAIGAPVETWARDFQTAMYADDNSFSVATAYQNPSWNFRSVFGGLGGFPLQARALTNNVALTLSMNSGGGIAYDRAGVATAQFATVVVTSSSNPPPATMFLSIVRTK